MVQFSRGCPHTCTYCGQWMFWKRWRYRRVAAFVDEMEWLYRTKGVRFFWIADENPTTLKDVWRQVLEEIARRRMDVGMCASIRAQDIVRDADILPIYKQAGFTYVLLGIETVTDETLARVRKGASVDDGYQAVRLLRQNGIMSIVDYIFGLDEETPRTIWRGLRGLHRYDGDFVNALYVTPHSWTPLGRAMGDAERVEEDQWKWDYRHQVVAVKALTPGQLFFGVKVVELLYHLHPRRLWRMLAAPDRRVAPAVALCLSPHQRGLPVRGVRICQEPTSATTGTTTGFVSRARPGGGLRRRGFVPASMTGIDSRIHQPARGCGLKTVGGIGGGNRRGVRLWPTGSLAKLRGAAWPNPPDAQPQGRILLGTPFFSQAGGLARLRAGQTPGLPSSIANLINNERIRLSMVLIPRRNGQDPPGQEAR